METLPGLLDSLLAGTRASAVVLTNDGVVRAQRFRRSAHRVALGDLREPLLNALHDLQPGAERRLVELFHPRGEVAALPIDADHNLVFIAGYEDDAMALVERAEAQREALAAALAAAAAEA